VSFQRIKVINMKRTNIKSTTLALLALTVCGMSSSVIAADVDVRLSTQEGWVGMPVVLQILINNAADYEQPTIPEIDGCDIRSAGAPSQSSQITIINGRQTQKRSVVMQYLITPRREGTFEIPPITIKVDGENVSTDKLQFVASKSPTGNLLFVEIDGAKDKVFVGQPLEMTLKIWVKPFQDKERNLTLSEGDMWQMISETTSWGGFTDRMKELAANNQRPGGQEVFRDDGEGHERSYYLYEITATIYPKRSGQIDADDVQIVVNYPTELGKARDPFAGFFEDRGFGGGSRLSQMMDEDFFSSPFGNRLTVSATRPIVGEAKVDSTEVLPVPSGGRPADYRGAVGRYNIVTQATPTTVNAGDPITLNIGIAGTGPMELVQAPPLSELPTLTADFKVADQSLAGFVQDDTKLFSTTVRPRREGITQIPSIPFSFFNPETEKYETVMSDPITITVDKSESLSLDAIVSRQHHSDGSSENTALARQPMEPEFTNDSSAAALARQSVANSGEWWWFFVIAPPIAWLVTLIVRNRANIGSRLPSFQSAASRCLKTIEHAQDSSDVVAAMTDYIGRRTRQKCSTAASAIGALRISGMSSVAIDVEAFFERCEQSRLSGDYQQSLTEFRQMAQALVEQIESVYDSISKSQVRRSKRTETSRAVRVRGAANTAQRASMLLIAAVVASSAGKAVADDVASTSRRALAPVTFATENSPTGASAQRLMLQDNQTTVNLSAIQQQTILTEAGDLYDRAVSIAKTDSAEASDLFTTAAQKYQLLVDSGVHNALLYRDLGNACLQSNQLGRAIASYERASQLAPNDRQLAVNLEFANSLVKGDDAKSETLTGLAAGDSTSIKSIVYKLRTYNSVLVSVAGMTSIIWTLVLSSLLFWGLQIVRAAGYRFHVWRLAIVPLLLLMMSLTSALLASIQSRSSENGILIANNVTLHSGDGEQFDAVVTLDTAQGHRVQILTSRGDWTQIKTRHGHTGWLPSRDVENSSPTCPRSDSFDMAK